jgi:hypothetical protein
MPPFALMSSIMEVKTSFCGVPMKPAHPVMLIMVPILIGSAA